MKQKPVSRSNNIIVQEFADEVLIYDLEKNKAFCLNRTSAMIWQKCDGNNSVTEISRKLSYKLKTNVSEEIVWLAVSQFKADGLLKNSNEFITSFDELSRREVVKRLALLR
ncbi:MAG: PqqD family protein [Blastocatellia bacterium]|nr:PqqD family protein [Blastocatellia bacterium]